MRKSPQIWLSVFLLCLATSVASAQSFRVQCPTSTLTHPPAPITAASDSAGTVTITSALVPSVGDVVIIAGVTPAGYNGTFSVTSVSAGTFSYADQPSAAISVAAEAGSTVTITSSLQPSVGDSVTITGVTPIGYNGGPFTVTAVGAGTFSYTGPTGLAAGGGGTAIDTTPLAAATVFGTVTDNNSEPAYNGPTQFNAPTLGVPAGTSGDFVTPVAGTVNGAIKCQQISGGDGYITEGDGTQTFMFSFGPLSGLADVAAGHASTQFPSIFNNPYPGTLTRGDPATTDGAASGAVPWSGAPGPYTPAFTWNGAVGLYPEITTIVTISDIEEGPLTAGTGTTPPSIPGCASFTPTTVTAWTDAPLGLPVGAQVVITNAPGSALAATPPGYAGTWTVTCVGNILGVPSGSGISPTGFASYAFQYVANAPGLAADTGNDIAAMAASPAVLDGHVDPRPIMDVGVMNGNLPGPMSAFDEDDEFFLTLTNVGMIMRPDLFEQHTVHFHGYPNASSFYDGVPDASIAINIGASFTYYYLAPDAGTYFWHCHITPPEHLQMGMVSQLYVRPRQDRVPVSKDLYTYLGYQNGLNATLVNGVPTLPNGLAVDPRTVCNPATDILCSATMPAIQTGATRPVAGTLCSGATVVSGTEGTTPNYVYNDGDGSTCYDVEYPIQMHGFDPNFHFVGMTFNPELFVDMKDKYFFLNGRSYPDTVAPGPQGTVSSDGIVHYSQPLPAIINIPAGGKALLRLVNLSVTEYHTLQSLGIPMKEVGFMAKLLRDQDGNNTEFYTNSITLGGGESLDVILDASDDGCRSFMGAGCAAKLYPPASTFYVYTPQLDHLSNDAENFGGMMTEVHICNSVSGPTHGNTCN